MERAALYLVVGILAFATSLSVGVLAAYVLTPSGNYDSGGGAPPLHSDITTDNGARTVPDDSSRQLDEGEVTFVHSATPENIGDNSTYIDHPLVNGDPDAILLVTRARGAEGADYPRELGVWYSGNRGGRWAVFNQDLSPMLEGAEFDVIIPEGDDKLVHRAKPANTESNITYIDHPLTNGNPGVRLSVTQNWNPGGGAGTYNNHPVGTVYDEAREQWTVYNEDLAAMPMGAAFNVAVSQASENT